MTGLRRGRVAIIGVGLMGGSLGWALRHAGAAEEVVGVDTDTGITERAVARGLCDRATTEPRAGVAGAEVVVVAVPVGSFEAVLRAARPDIDPEAVVTDVGSVKAPVVAAAREVLGPEGPAFVGGHPITGTEDSGVEAAFGDLYQGALCVLTPGDETSALALGRIRRLWEAVGAEVEFMDPAEHDRILALTSHLPHMLAYGLIRTLGSLPREDRLIRFAAGGFRDLTRIAGSDPVMWRDIAFANREPLLEMIDRFQENLNIIRQHIEKEESSDLEALLQEARVLRRGLGSGGGGAADEG